MPTIKVPPVLRPQTNGESEVSVEGVTVGEVLRALAERYPATKDQLFSPEGELNRYVNVYLNDEDVRVLDGLETSAADSDTVVILPAMAGGGIRRSGEAHSPSLKRRARVRPVRPRPPLSTLRQSRCPDR
jgi:sulfur-carrier protein